MSSYAQQFLIAISKKAKNKRQVIDGNWNEGRQVITSKNKIDIEKVYDWKVVEERHRFNNKICSVVDDQRDYEEILHEEGNEGKDEEKEIATHGNPYKSPLNELFPLSRFAIEENIGDNSKEAEVEAQPSGHVAQVNDDDDDEENKNEEEQKEDHKQEERERRRLKPSKEQKNDSLENDLNVTADQMNILKIEVKKIQKEYTKQKEMLSRKRHHDITIPHQIKGRLTIPKKSIAKEQQPNVKPHQLNEIEKNNPFVVNNTNQYIFSNYPNPNGMQMMPYSYQMPVYQPLPLQIQIEKASPQQYPQPFYFNPAFPTELPYNPSIHQPQKNNPKKKQMQLKRNNKANQSNSHPNVLQPLIDLEAFRIKPPEQKPASKREITYKPKTVKEYRDKYEGKNSKKRLGGLGPNLGTREWNEKHWRAVKRKDYSDNVDLTHKSSQNNLKIIHHDQRLNKKIKRGEAQEEEKEKEKEDAFLQIDDSLDENNGVNKLSIDPHLHNEGNEGKDSDANDRVMDNNRMIENTQGESKKYCTTQENKNQKKMKRKTKPSVHLPSINKTNTRSSSHNHLKEKQKPQNSDEEVQFPNQDLNRLYLNHQALLSKVNNIKLSIYK